MCEGGGGQLLPGASLPDPGQQTLNSTYCGTIPQTFTERDGTAWISVVYSVERAVQPDPAFIGSWGPWTRWEVEEEVERVLNRLFSVGVDDVGFEELRLGMGSALTSVRSSRCTHSCTRCDGGGQQGVAPRGSHTPHLRPFVWACMIHTVGESCTNIHPCGIDMYHC